MVLATELMSPTSLICKTEPGKGANSWIFGAPTTTGIVPIKSTKVYNISTHHRQVPCPQ